MKKIVPILVLIITVYLLNSLVVPLIFRSEMIFLANTALWATIILATIFLSKQYSTQMWKIDKSTIQFSAIIGTFPIFLAIFLSFFLGFGKNPAVWNLTTITIYLPYILAIFIATELSRAYLTKTITKNNPLQNLILTSLLYTIITASITKYADLTTPLAISEFLIKTFIPTLSTNLLATYLAYRGGLPANLTYMAIPAFFTWFSPILPNPSWQVQSIITVSAATFGFLTIDTAIRPQLAKRAHRTFKKEKSQLPYWTIIALFGLIAVWSSTGLLGFTPTIIGSQSMQPTLNPGDITLIINAPPQTIQVGDIIQYQTTAEPIVHRVIDKYEDRGYLWFVTQGDANPTPDERISERDVMGKSVLTIPKLGWASIALKEFAILTYTFFTTTVPQALTNAGSFIITNGVYITSALAFTAYSYLLLTYKTIKKEEKT